MDHDIRKLMAGRMGQRELIRMAAAIVLGLAGCGQEEGVRRSNPSPPAFKTQAPPIIPAEPRKFLPDPPVLDQIRALDRKLIGVVEYETEGIFPDYPTVERDTVTFKSNPEAPSNAVAMIHELPTTILDGRTVACGGRKVRIECYDDETMDIVAHDRLLTKDWYEMEDGSRVPVGNHTDEERKERTGRLYHVRPEGDYTVQSIIPGVVVSRTTDSAEEVLSQNVPWKIVEQAQGLAGGRVERDSTGQVMRIEAPLTGRGLTLVVECSGWEDLPVRHPRFLSQTYTGQGGRRVEKIVRFVRVGVEGGT